MGWTVVPAAAAAAEAIAASFLMLAASMFAARFGVGWLAEMDTAGFDTKDVSREMSLGVGAFCGGCCGSVVTGGAVVTTVGADCVLMICIAGGFAEGGITGRASWASRELTTPKLGAR
uniref:(northern house mosquito) hypothetical protein n=1 Tax=Culex pipiens TaxID=7175 RepID=A0A8D8FVI8_CULPI